MAYALFSLRSRLGRTQAKREAARSVARRFLDARDGLGGLLGLPLILLLLLPWKIWRDRKGRIDFYTPCVDLFLVVYLLISAFFQQYPPEIYILASVLLVRGLSLYSLQRNGRKKSYAGQKNISHQHG